MESKPSTSLPAKDARLLPFSNFAITLFSCWVVSAGAVWEASFQGQNTKIAAVTSLVSLFSVTMTIYGWVMRVREEFHSLNTRLASLTTELAELKHSKSQ